MDIETPIPYGRAYISGFRLVYNPYFFKRGKNEGKVKCYYRKGKGFKSIILKIEEITPMKIEEEV